jgi:putative transposase
LPRLPPRLRYGSDEDALGFCRRFFGGYNDEHRHSGIGFHTPADVYYGRAELIGAQRAMVLEGAYAAHPEANLNLARSGLRREPSLW